MTLTRQQKKKFRREIKDKLSGPDKPMEFDTNELDAMADAIEGMVGKMISDVVKGLSKKFRDKKTAGGITDEDVLHAVISVAQRRIEGG